nr:hypothetical protein [Tanacetum cinerariifolium]GEZ91181.1 hypothetical protein [Tanacetum cinerariifolium]
MFVIEQPIPPAPAADSEANMLAEWNAIYDAYNEVACRMLRSMTPELHRQFEKFSPYDMLHELKLMFEKQAGVKSDFTGFVRNYNMHNMANTIGELHAMLIEYEKGLPKKAEIPQVMMIKSGKIQKPNKKSLKANGKGKDKQVYIPKPKNRKPSAKEHPAKDNTCHHCKEVGHWKRNCHVYLAELLKKNKQVGSASSSDNCHYAPSITRGVVSVHRLVEKGFVQCFMDFGIPVSKNNVHYFNDIPSNGIYEIDMHDLVSNVNSIYNVSTKNQNIAWTLLIYGTAVLLI